MQLNIKGILNVSFEGVCGTSSSGSGCASHNAGFMGVRRHWPRGILSNSG